MNTFDYSRSAVTAVRESRCALEQPQPTYAAQAASAARSWCALAASEEVRVQAVQLRVVQLQRRADHGRPGVHLRLLAHPGRVAALERGDLGADVRHARSQPRHEGRDLAARRSQRLDAIQQARALHRSLVLRSADDGHYEAARWRGELEVRGGERSSNSQSGAPSTDAGRGPAGS